MRSWIKWSCVFIIAELAAVFLGWHFKASLFWRVAFGVMPIVAVMLVTPYVCMFHCWASRTRRAIAYVAVFAPWLALVAFGTAGQVQKLSKIVVHGHHLHPSFAGMFASNAMGFVILFGGPKAIAELRVLVATNPRANAIAMTILGVLAPGLAVAMASRQESRVRWSQSTVNFDMASTTSNAPDCGRANDEYYRSLRSYQDDQRALHQAEDALQLAQQRKADEEQRRRYDEDLRRRQ